VFTSATTPAPILIVEDEFDAFLRALEEVSPAEVMQREVA
jgi:hypothetical protein